MAFFSGTAGNDNLIGTANADVFKLQQGGNDIALGKGGDDEFRMGGALNAADAINGGAGIDRVILEGDYSTGVVFADTTMVSVQTLKLKGAFDYALTLADGNVDTGELLTIDASALAVGGTLIFDGSAETNGKYEITGGLGDDDILGGGKADKFDLTLGGHDRVNGRAGKDTFNLGDKLDSTDSIVGGKGADALKISGMGADDAINFNATMMTGIEKIVVTADAEIRMDLVDANIAAGETLFADGSSCVTRLFSCLAPLETDGHVDVIGGSAGGVLRGGNLSDTLTMSSHAGIYFLTGAGGADVITCGSGIDTLVYTAASQSNSSAIDVINGLDLNSDKFDMDVAVNNVFTTSGSVSAATFDANMGTILTDYVCAIVNVTGGDLLGKSYLVINADTGNGFIYVAGDYVMEITGFTGTLDTGDFI
jgi:Ca2+-binding RTX toxin-like protein